MRRLKFRDACNDVIMFTGTLSDVPCKSRTCDPHLDEVVLSHLSCKIFIRYRNNNVLTIAIAFRWERYRKPL